MDFQQIIDCFKAGDPISLAIVAVSILILICSVVAIVISIYLAISYVKYNRKKNTCGLTGEQAARKILDANGLQHIRVKAVGSILFGNSYSHYFKKVRLRRLTWKKQSVASLAMAAQKSSLAVLDKEKDPDMKRRIRLVPIIDFGPFFFIPLLLIGIIADALIYGKFGTFSLICAIVGLLFYLFSFILSLSVLKTEKKAQKRAIEILKENKMATGDEIEDMKSLFRLYNIEYVNNMILAMLELIYKVLQVVAVLQGNSSSSSNK